MKVLKFGGSSLASSSCIKQAGNIILSNRSEESLVIVVSAIGKTTEKLIHAGMQAASGQNHYQTGLLEIEELHLRLARELFSVIHQSEVLAEIKLILNRVEELTAGIYTTRDFSDKTRDKLLMYGEVLSANLMFKYLNRNGFQVNLLDPLNLIRTDDQYGYATVDWKITDQMILKSIEREKNYILPGFIAATAEGIPTTLGRDGSDYSAAIVAASMKAGVLEIWTDVPGIMTADPRMVPQARPIAILTYEEAMELSTFGSRVIHPPALQPVLQKNIDVVIRNTFSPENPGTRISRRSTDQDHPVKGISMMNNIVLLTLTGSSMIGVPGIAGRLFLSLSRQKINVIFITQASSEHSISLGIMEEHLKEAEKAIREEFAPEMALQKVNPVGIESGLAIVAIVGHNMKRKIGLSGQTFAALGKNGINVIAIAQGSTERNISVVISGDDSKKALNVLHETFFLSRIKRVHLFITGTGNVGSALLGQLAGQEEYIKKEFSLEFKVCGLANTTSMVLDPDGIPPGEWKKQLARSKQKTNMDLFVKTMKQFNLRNSVFVDNTANQNIADLYPEILKGSISLVTSNKIALSGPLEVYNRNKRLAREKNANLLFEANVGAGLPVIKTIHDLVQSGDQIQSIEAVLSGTLNYIFNTFNADKPFSVTVREAMEKGFTEPDPRLDLAGTDVARKILILARESGVPLEPEEVEKDDFLPEECRNTNNLSVFFTLLKKNDPFFEKMRTVAEKKGRKLRYIARFKDGKARTGLQEIDTGHPFYELDGKDNILLFFTERYHDQPLVIRGAGAGADVTAAGVFADLMRIAR